MNPTIIQTIDCSPDNIHIVCGQGIIVRMYDLQLKQIGCDMIGHLNKINVVKYSPNGGVIASGGSHSQVCIWDSKTQVKISNFIDHENVTTCLSFSPDSQYLAIGSQDMTIKIINLSQNTIKKDFGVVKNSQYNTLRVIDYSADGNQLISCSKVILLWDLRQMKCQKINLQKDMIYTVKYLDRQVLISNSKQKSTKIWVQKSQKLIRKWKLGADQMILSPDKKYVLCFDKIWQTMILRSIETGKIREFHSKKKVRFVSLSFSNDGKSIITQINNTNMSLSIISLEEFQKVQI